MQSFQELIDALQQNLTPDELQKPVRIHLPGSDDGEAFELGFVTDNHGQKRIPYLKVRHYTSGFLQQLCKCGDKAYHP